MEALGGFEMRYESCKNCANGERVGGVIRCKVRGIFKTKPYKSCGNYERMKPNMVTMEEVHDNE